MNQNHIYFFLHEGILSCAGIRLEVSYLVSSGLSGQYPDLATSQEHSYRECLHTDIFFVENSFQIYNKTALSAS